MVSIRLPVDVVRLVLDEIIDWKDEPLWHMHEMRGRCTWLAEVFNVSRAWYIAGLSLLYRLIEISPHDETTLDQLMCTLRRRPDLAELVRIVRPYEREYYDRDPRTDVKTSEILKFNDPGVLFLTKSRTDWREPQRVSCVGSCGASRAFPRVRASIHRGPRVALSMDGNGERVCRSLSMRDQGMYCWSNLRFGARGGQQDSRCYDTLSSEHKPNEA